MRERPPGQRTRVEEEGSARVRNLYSGSLRHFLQQAEEGDLWFDETWRGGSGADGGDANGAAGEEGEDETVSEVVVGCEGEHSRRGARGVGWCGPGGSQGSA